MDRSKPVSISTQKRRDRAPPDGPAGPRSRPLIGRYVIMAKLKHPIVDTGVTRDTPVPQVISYSRHLSTSVKGDARFAVLLGLVVPLDKDTDDLEKAQGPAQGRGKGTA